MSVAADKVREIASYSTGAGMGIWGLTFNQWLALGGFTLAFLTLLINWYYKHLHYELEKKKADK